MFQSPEISPASYDLALMNCPRPVLKVLGLGGGGCNAIERMMELELRGIDFIAANTDAQALKMNPAPTKILLGPQTTRGLGSVGTPPKGGQQPRKAGKRLPRRWPVQIWSS